MKTITCEKCGANIEYKKGSKIQKCQFCGAEMIFETKDSSGEDLIEKANVLLENQEFEKAQSLFDKYIDDNPTSYLGWIGKAKSISKNFKDVSEKNIGEIKKLIKNAKNVADEKEKELIDKELKHFYELEKAYNDMQNKNNNINLYSKISIAIFAFAIVVSLYLGIYGAINYSKMSVIFNIISVVLDFVCSIVASTILYYLFTKTFARWFEPTTTVKKIFYILFNIVLAAIVVIVCDVVLYA